LRRVGDFPDRRDECLDAGNCGGSTHTVYALAQSARPARSRRPVRTLLRARSTIPKGLHVAAGQLQVSLHHCVRIDRSIGSDPKRYQQRGQFYDLKPCKPSSA
jgi:hypothetical protein